MADRFYSTREWRDARERAIERAGGDCSAAPDEPGRCSPGPLHVHHDPPLRELLAAGADPLADDVLHAVCPYHHGVWDALLRGRAVRSRRRSYARA